MSTDRQPLLAGASASSSSLASSAGGGGGGGGGGARRTYSVGVIASQSSINVAPNGAVEDRDGDGDGDGDGGGEGEGGTYVVYTRRWVMLAVFCVMSALYNFLVFAYVPVTTAVCEFYNGGTCTGDDNEAVSIEYVLAGRERARVCARRERKREEESGRGRRGLGRGLDVESRT